MLELDKNILIVDDEAAILEILEFEFEFSEELKFKNIFKAFSGKEALNIIQNEKIDFIITDMQMPNGDGKSIIKGLDEMNKDIPLVIHSGFGHCDELKFLKYEAFVSKPGDMSDFFKIIKEKLC